MVARVVKQHADGLLWMDNELASLAQVARAVTSDWIFC